MTLGFDFSGGGPSTNGVLGVGIDTSLAGKL